MNTSLTEGTETAKATRRMKHIEANDVLTRLEDRSKKLDDLLSEIRGDPTTQPEKSTAIPPISLSSFLDSLSDRLRTIESIINTRIEDIRKELF